MSSRRFVEVPSPLWGYYSSFLYSSGFSSNVSKRDTFIILLEIYRALATQRDQNFIPEAKRVPDFDNIFSSEQIARSPDAAGGSFQTCRRTLDQGCYEITWIPYSMPVIYHGTMRIDRSRAGTTISGDLYEFPHVPHTLPSWLPLGAVRADMPEPEPSPSPAPFRRQIPIYPRDRYFSYLSVIRVHTYLRETYSHPGSLVQTVQCPFRLDIVRFTYNKEHAYNESPFKDPTVFSIDLTETHPPFGFPGRYYEGAVYQGRVAKGSFTMGWISPLFRRATLEIHAVRRIQDAPGAVGTEDFHSVFKSAGWDLKVIYNPNILPVPPQLSTNVTWTPRDLHELMSPLFNLTADLDRDWKVHMLVFPGQLGGERGRSFDDIDVPRQAVVVYSDAGYETPDGLGITHPYGTAANQMQINVPRAYLRNACHEVGHAFNQVHQDRAKFGEDLGEPGPDNSIMTTTPGVADVLAGPTSGLAGVFPDDIILRFNHHVRHHMIHFPDIVVRPGGERFEVGHKPKIDEAEPAILFLSAGLLALNIILPTNKIKLGEPLPIKWELVNKSKESIPVPNDISLESLFAQIIVSDPDGESKEMPSVAIVTDSTSIQDLASGGKLVSNSLLFWSCHMFAFAKPGRHKIELKIVWNYQDLRYGVAADMNIWVDYPSTEGDNDIASLLLHDEVGKFVALDGAPHLKEAVSRIEQAISKYPDHPASKFLKELRGHKYYKQKNKLSVQEHSE